MTFKVKSVVTPEQLLQMKAMTVQAPHEVKVTRSRGTINEESNVPFVMSERVVFLRAMDKLKVIRKTYA